MKMPRFARVLSLFVVCVLGACQATGSAVGRNSMKPGLAVAMDDATNGMVDLSPHGWASRSGNRGSTASAEVDAPEEHAPTNQSAPETTDRMLVYTGTIAVEVPREDDAMRDFLAKVKEWGGYLKSQQGTTLTVRIPATQFDAAFAFVRAAGRVLHEAREANDVTEEFLDLGIRLDNARKSRDRLLEVLKKADKVEDILKVEAELRRLTEEIERMEGRQKFLADQVAMATVAASFQATAAAQSRRSPQLSRFDWINRVGPPALMEGF